MDFNPFWKLVWAGRGRGTLGEAPITITRAVRPHNAVGPQMQGNPNPAVIEIDRGGALPHNAGPGPSPPPPYTSARAFVFWSLGLGGSLIPHKCCPLTSEWGLQGKAWPFLFLLHLSEALLVLPCLLSKKDAQLWKKHAWVWISPTGAAGPSWAGHFQLVLRDGGRCSGVSSLEQPNDHTRPFATTLCPKVQSPLEAQYTSWCDWWKQSCSDLLEWPGLLPEKGEH